MLINMDFSGTQVIKTKIYLTEIVSTLFSATFLT